MLLNPTRPQNNEEARKKRERELLLLILFLGGALDQQARHFVAGNISQSQFLFVAMSLIRQSHYKAASLGVQQTGATAYNPWSVANRAASAQESFVEAFSRDLANGRYDPKSDGGSGAAARKARFNLYGLRLTGTANDAWLKAAQALNLEVLWVLGDVEDHCDVCPQLANRGWQSAKRLHQVPGDGQTPCLVQCKCHLETRYGIKSFRNN
jgi:hypothetical protein